MTKWGAIFDWDGVVVDSSFPHEESWRRLARENSHPWPEDFFKRGFGMKNETIIRNLFAWTNDEEEIKRLSKRKEELYRSIVDEVGISLIKGVSRWLDELNAAGIPCAVGSSTPGQNIAHVIERLKLGRAFSAIVASEDVTYGKPDPQVFLLCAKRLGVPPYGCVVFEDTPVGIKAAKAASMKAIALATTHSRENLAGADLIINNFSDLTIEKTERLFLGCRKKDDIKCSIS